jgi:hypothetical protein
MGDGGSLIRSALRRLIVPLVLVCQAHLPVRHQKRVDPVVVSLLQDPISDRRGLLRDGEALAESLGEGLQQGARELADGTMQRADRGRIEGEQPEPRALQLLMPLAGAAQPAVPGGAGPLAFVVEGKAARVPEGHQRPFMASVSASLRANS